MLENAGVPAATSWPMASAEVQVPWLVLLRIRNSGRVTISGKEFNTALTFTFPGREVRDVAVIRPPAPASAASSR